MVLAWFSEYEPAAVCTSTYKNSTAVQVSILWAGDRPVYVMFKMLGIILFRYALKYVMHASGMFSIILILCLLSIMWRILFRAHFQIRESRRSQVFMKRDISHNTQRPFFSASLSHLCLLHRVMLLLTYLAQHCHLWTHTSMELISRVGDVREVTIMPGIFLTCITFPINSKIMLNIFFAGLAGEAHCW